MKAAVCNGLGWASLVLWGVVNAQTPSEIESMRQDIATQRSVVEHSYTATLRDCYQQFAVNDCLISARQYRSAALAEIKRQEVVLNDDDRKRKAAAQVRKIEEKTSAEAVQKAAAQRSQRAESAQHTQQRLNSKHGDATDAKATPSEGKGDSQSKKAPTPRVRPAAQPKLHDSAEAVKAFTQKQREAELRQADVEKSRRDRAKPLATALPEMGVAPTPLASQLAAPPSKPLPP